MSFLEQLHARPLVADGAMGTMINAKGVGFERSFESLNLSQPDLVRDIHRSFIEAGSDLIETNTFSATPIHLDRWGVSSTWADINASGVRLAREASVAAGRQVFVAGSVGPTGMRLAPTGPLSASDAARAFADQIDVLVNEGVDLLVFETFADLDELEIAIREARRLCSLPIVASMSFGRDVRTVGDVVPEVALTRLVAAGADVVGANCSTGPRGVFEVLDRYHEHASGHDGGSGFGIPFSGMPNAGYPESRGERLFFPAPPDYFETYARQFLEVGARIIGGCCGTTPAHIVGVRRALNTVGVAPLRLRRRTPEVTERSDDRSEASLAEPTLTRAFHDRRFAITVEMEPPRSASTTQLENRAALLRDAGATVLNIADTPMARMRMTGLAAAHRVQSATGLEAVLHFPVRGRNLLRVQGDLLAAHPLNVRTLFVTMGDLASIGDYPQAFDHHDIVPTGLVKLVMQHFNVGVDSSGTSIGEPCSFAVGVAANLTPADFDAEAKLLKKKVDFGANFALTQPVFDPPRARKFLAHYANLYGPLTLPLLSGVLPLASGRHALFLRNEVPGMSVPDALLSQMDRAGDNGRSVGREIAMSTIQELRDIVQGVYFIPAFRRYEDVAELIAQTVAAAT